MSTEAIQIALGVIGLLTTIMLGAFGYVLGRQGKIEESIVALAKSVEAAKVHMAENYVRGHEIDRLERAIDSVRSEVNSAIGALRTEVQNQVGGLTQAVMSLVKQ